MCESIQKLGNTYMYLPRDVQTEDLILYEDVISKFKLTIPIEMYLTNVDGFSGDKEMFSKFGIELRNSYKLVVSKARWNEEVKTLFDDNLGNTEATFDINYYVRPREGDLIYDPITKYLLEIKFVDHDVEFYALGKNYQYYLTCEAFMYQNEAMDTGNSDIDIFNINSMDKLNNQILMESDAAIVFEQGGYTLLEDVSTMPSDHVLTETGLLYIYEQGGHIIQDQGVHESPIREFGSQYKGESSRISFNLNDPFA